MDETTALSKMVAPGTRRPTKWKEGVIQIWVTRACDKACYGCTQGSNLAGNPGMITVEQFERAVLSLKGYFGVVGVFGGNPAMHPKFDRLCAVLRKHVPFEQRGLWCNSPMGWGKEMRATFNPAYSNLNVHLDRTAYDEFRRDWPEAHPFGLTDDSRHSPPYVAMRDVIADEGERWELISSCDINRYWSAMIGVFRGELRAWFCEVAGAQSMLHQHEPDYPDTGVALPPPGHIFNDYGRFKAWWEQPMEQFAHQVRKHCHDCGVPLRGRGELASALKTNGGCPKCHSTDLDLYQTMDFRKCRGCGHVFGVDEMVWTGAKEQVSETHAAVYVPKRKGRAVELVTVRSQLGECVTKATDYIGNAKAVKP